MNKPQRTLSIAFKLRLYFVTVGSLAFGLILILFLSVSDTFADRSVRKSMNSIGADVADSLYVSNTGAIELDDSEVVLKWGFDVFYLMVYR